MARAFGYTRHAAYFRPCRTNPCADNPLRSVTCAPFYLALRPDARCWSLDHAVAAVRRASIVCTWSANGTSLRSRIGPLINGVSRRCRSPLHHRASSFCAREVDRGETLSFPIDNVVVDVFFICGGFTCVDRARGPHVAQIVCASSALELDRLRRGRFSLQPTSHTL